MRIPGIRYVQGRNSYSDADGTKYGIAIHNTSNNATAAGEASYAARRTDGTSAHFYVDDHEVIQSLDTNARAGHAASRNGNENAIAVEITGTNDKTRAWWLANVAWPDLGRVLAACCREYGIAVRRATVSEMKTNPRVKAFYSHNDMRLAWAGTTHTDPGPNFPWDRLFDAVNAALSGAPNPTEDDDMDQATFNARMDAYAERLSGLNGESDAQKRLRRNWVALVGVNDLSAAVGQVDEAVVEQLGAGDLTAAQKADLLRPVLGDDAAAVGSLLALA